MRKLVVTLAWIGFGFVTGILGVWFLDMKNSEILALQGAHITGVLHQSDQKRSTRDQVLKRLSVSFLPIEWREGENPLVLGIKPEVSPLGIGGRWIIYLHFDENDVLTKSTCQMHPIGMP